MHYIAKYICIINFLFGVMILFYNSLCWRISEHCNVSYKYIAELCTYRFLSQFTFWSLFRFQN